MHPFLQRHGIKLIRTATLCILGTIFGFIWQRSPRLRSIVFDPNVALNANPECFSTPFIPDEFNALTPQVAIRGCDIMSKNSNDGGIIRKGCKAPIYSSYIIEGTTTKHIITAEQFISQFAPVETPGEALAFALALTDTFPVYELDLSDTFRILADELLPTTITMSGDKYIIDLFSWEGCGCGPHTTYQKRIAVSIDGQITELESYPAYQDPQDDTLCID